MRGSYKRMQARIKVENSLAIYVHCNAHIILNLCLVDLAKQVCQVRNVFDTLNVLHNFVGTLSKGQALFEKMRSTLHISTNDAPTTCFKKSQWH